MKTLNFKSAFPAVLLALSAASCNVMDPGPLPENIVGDEPGELQAKLGELMAQAGTDSTKVEFAEITSTFRYRPDDNTAHVSVQLVSPKDKNKLEQFSWNDMKDRRNVYEQAELTVSTSLGSDLVDTYEGYKEMLFTYKDAAVYLNNLPAYCKEALEASGYKDEGYVSSFQMETRGVSISVTHKKGGMSKTYRIADDGQHIVVSD